ncbi:MAG TPA: RNA polymerase sigma factor [Bacteroidia bacterium]|nr:RNA polymerase sigma factor [Bacteroidia bacterium]
MDSVKKLGEPEIIALMKDPLRKELGLNALMELFQRPLYCHIRKMVGDHDDSDDILQNTFIKAWRFFDGFRAESSLKTWLFRIATNECLTLLEKRKRRNLSDLRDIENNLGHSEQVTSTIGGEDIQKKLAAAIETLPDKQKQVFVMKYYDELKYAEMVQILGGTEGSLKASFHHAVKKIENYLQAG